MSGMLLNRRDVVKSALGLAVTATLPFGARAKDKAKIASTALGDRLLLVSGAGGNVVALRGEEGLLLVDSGGPGLTGKLQGELKHFAPGAKVVTLINTHWHAPHTGGNETFGKAGAKIIAHAKTAQRLAVDQWVPWEDRYIKAAPKPAIPTEVFYLGSKTLTFGGEQIEYGYLQQPHTDGDLYVYFGDANVLVVGDAVAAPDADPVLCWYEGGWLGGRVDSLAKLLALGNDATRVVTASGAAISRAEVKTEQAAIAQAFDRVSDAMRKGFTIEDMQNAKLLDGLPRKWSDPNTFLYAAEKSMWAHHNKLSHSVV